MISNIISLIPTNIDLKKNYQEKEHNRHVTVKFQTKNKNGYKYLQPNSSTKQEKM